MLINYNMYWLLQKNVKEMMDVNGIKVLVDLLTLAHLHTTRAVVPFQVMFRFEKVIFFHPTRSLISFCHVKCHSVAKLIKLFLRIRIK